MLTRWQAAVGELLILGLALFVSLDALLRWLANWSFLVTDELGGYALLVIAFFGMAVALQERALFRVEVLFQRLSAAGQRWMQLLFDLASLGFAIILAWQFISLSFRTHARGIVAPTILRTPLWIPQSVMAIGACMIVLVLASQVWVGVRNLRRSAIAMPNQPDGRH